MEIHYEYALKQKEVKNQIISDINLSGIPLVLFGWRNAQTIEDFLDTLDCRPQYLCDNDTKKQGKTMLGCKVISPSDLPKLYSRYNVLILAAKHFESMSAQLRELIAPPEKIYCLDFYNEGRDTATYFKSQEEKISYIYNHLSDDISRKTFEAVINYRMYRSQHLLSEIIQPTEDQYFPNKNDFIFPISQDEIFVDAGAYNGDTVRSFLHKCPGGICKAVHAFEPDPTNFVLLQKSTAQWSSFVHCYQLGLSDEHTTVSFCSDLGVSSYIQKDGATCVQVDSLDNVLGDVPVTFIKMDVEGAECAALRGAKNIIRKYIPKLAICTYHSDEDMVNIPLLIWKINPDYSLYFRHYTNLATETVCYALPPQ